MKCCIYLRVSGASQIDTGGFDRQEATCRALATTKGFDVVRVFREEGVSGTKESADRPAYQAMLTHMEESGVAIILVEHLDRLARFFRVQETLLYDLLNRGLTLYAGNTGENVTEAMKSSPMNLFIVQLQGLLSQLDRSQTILKLNKGRDRVRDAGGKAEGRYAFGHDPKLPDEVPVLSEMTAMKDRGATCEQIALTLNLSGKMGRSGCPWKAATVAKIIRREAA